MKRKISIRLITIAMIAVIATSVGITFVYYNIFQKQVMGDLKQNAILLMETDIFQNAYNSEKTDFDSINNLTSDSLRITWIDNDGDVLFDDDTDIHELSNHLDRPEIQNALKYGEGESIRLSDTMNMNTFYYALRLENGTVLRVSTQAHTVYSVFFRGLPVIVAVSMIVLLICVVIGRLVIKQLMKPIEDMAENLDNSSNVSVYKELEPFAEKIRSQHESILASAKMRQDFTANVSHELKTPITAISGYAELIENGMVDESQHVYIASQIRHNADRLQSLVTDIIKLSELDHKELPRKFEAIDLLEIVNESVKDYYSAAESRNISIHTGGKHAITNGDRSLIRELIDNLLQNAVRYNKDNGSVSIEVGTRDGHSYISVSDTGIGIPEDEQGRIFERFYRVDKSRSRKTGGTGLGLAIVKHIAEIHSAEIRIESELDKRTEITVIF